MLQSVLHNNCRVHAMTCAGQVLLSEGELTDSEGDSNGSGGSGGAANGRVGHGRRSLARTSNGRGAAALMRSRSQAGLLPGSSPEADRSVCGRPRVSESPRTNSIAQGCQVCSQQNAQVQFSLDLAGVR